MQPATPGAPARPQPAVVAAVLVLGLAVAACGGARSPGREAIAPAASPASITPGAGDATPSQPAATLPPAASPAAGAGGGSGSALSTQEASQLLDQVDGLLGQLDGELAADADDAAN